MNKKGSLEDISFWIVVAVITGMVLLFSGTFVSEINDKVQERADFAPEAKTFTTNMKNMYGTTIDDGFIMFFIGLIIIAIILAGTIVIHPAFLVLYIPLLAFNIYFAAIMSNFYQRMAENQHLQGIAVEMTFQSFVLTYLPIIVFFSGVLLGIIMYKTWENRQ